MAGSTDTRLRIDAHVHLVAADRVKHGSFMAEHMRSPVVEWYFRRFAGVGRLATDEELDVGYARNLARKVAEARHLDKAVIFAMDGLYDDNGRLDPRTAALVSNDWTIEVARTYPGEFLLGASIHPARPDAIDELDRLAEAGAVCVKWVPPSMNIDASEPRYERFYERMREHGMVLTSHTGYEHSVFVVDQTLGDPSRLRLPLEVGLKVVAGHSGTSGFIHRVEYFPNMVAMAERYDNLYADTSALLNIVRAPYRKRLLEADVLADRLIQGTDFPVPPMPLLWPFALGPVEAVRLQVMADRNPFDADYLAKREAGFPEEHFLRGHDVFLGAGHGPAERKGEQADA